MQDLSQDNNEEYEELSLKMLALQLYSDELVGLNCSTCEDETKKENNCDMKDTDVSVFYNDVLEISINTCPLNCIFIGHYSFIDKYIYYTTTSAQMPSYDDCDASFWRLYKKFDRYHKLLESAKMKRGGNA